MSLNQLQLIGMMWHFLNRLIVRLHQPQLAETVQDDSLLCFVQPEKISYVAKQVVFHLRSNNLFENEIELHLFVIL